MARTVVEMESRRAQLAKALDRMLELGFPGAYEVLLQPFLADTDLGDLDSVCQPRAVLVVQAGGKDLCFAFQSSKCSAMNNPITITLERPAIRVGRFGNLPTPAIVFCYGVLYK